MTVSKYRRLAGRVPATGSIVITMFGAALTPAAEATVHFSLEAACGYQGWGEYRHCDGGTGSTVGVSVGENAAN